MEKSEVLELLQFKARKMSDLEKWFIGNNEKRLAEFACVWRLINFKVQDIISATPKNDLDKALTLLQADLYSSMESARESQIMTISELYGSALNYLSKLRTQLLGYLP